MNEIRYLLRSAAKRLEMTSFLMRLHVVAVIAAGVALVLAFADRAPGEPFVSWRWVAPAFVASALLAAVILWTRRRLTELQVALNVDDRLDLRERLSTAIQIHDRDDAFAQAAVDDAVSTARDPRAREQVNRRFRVLAPARWWISPLLIVTTAVVLLLPQADLFAGDEDVDEEQMREAQTSTSQALKIIAKEIEDKPELQKELGDLAEELGSDGAKADALEKPEDIKRDAIKKVTELNKRLDEIVNGEKGKTAKALKDMMSKLKAPSDGPGKELADAMAKGNFAEAKKQLEKLLSELDTDGMSKADKDALEKQLQDIAGQLEQLAQQQQALEKALQQAGLSPQLANNPQALQQALQQAQNLNEQQKQQLQQMIQAQQQAQQMCQGLGGACKKMAMGMAQGKPGQGGQQMANQLNDMEQLQQLLQQAQAMANQCQGQGQKMGKGMCLAQALQQWNEGPGMGNRGRGSGGEAPISKTPYKNKIEKVDVPTVEGEITGSMLIEGVPFKGESRATLKRVFEQEAAGYDEAIDEQPLHRRYHEAQKHYFGELVKQVEALPAAIEEKSGAGGSEEPASGAGNATEKGEEPAAGSGADE